jgi:phage shock protein B
MFEDLDKILGVAVVFLGLPWLIFHYVTRWKTSATITGEDEKLLDELHELARRLEERVGTIERIMTAENPEWRHIGVDPAGMGIEDNSSIRRIVK